MTPQDEVVLRLAQRVEHLEDVVLGPKALYRRTRHAPEALVSRLDDHGIRLAVLERTWWTRAKVRLRQEWHAVCAELRMEDGGPTV